MKMVTRQVKNYVPWQKTFVWVVYLMPPTPTPILLTVSASLFTSHTFFCPHLTWGEEEMKIFLSLLIFLGFYSFFIISKGTIFEGLIVSICSYVSHQKWVMVTGTISLGQFLISSWNMHSKKTAYPLISHVSIWPLLLRECKQHCFLRSEIPAPGVLTYFLTEKLSGSCWYCFTAFAFILFWGKNKKKTHLIPPVEIL